MSCGGFCVLMYRFFIAKMSQSVAGIQYRGFFSVSLKQYEHSFCSGERSHLLDMGMSLQFVCMRVGMCVCVSD